MSLCVFMQCSPGRLIPLIILFLFCLRGFLRKTVLFLERGSIFMAISLEMSSQNKLLKLNP